MATSGECEKVTDILNMVLQCPLELEHFVKEKVPNCIDRSTGGFIGSSVGSLVEVLVDVAACGHAHVAGAAEPPPCAGELVAMWLPSTTTRDTSPPNSVESSTKCRLLHCGYL